MSLYDIHLIDFHAWNNIPYGNAKDNINLNKNILSVLI